MNRDSAINLLWDVGAAIVLVMLPVAIYFKHNDYPLGNPEAVLILTMVLVAGLFWGVVMNVGGGLAAWW